MFKFQFSHILAMQSWINDNLLEPEIPHGGDRHHGFLMEVTGTMEVTDIPFLTGVENATREQG